MTLKVTQGHRNCSYSMGHLLVVCNNVSILHHFRDITVYVTTYDIEKLKLQAMAMRFPIHM